MFESKASDLEWNAKFQRTLDKLSGILDNKRHLRPLAK